MPEPAIHAASGRPTDSSLTSCAHLQRSGNRDDFPNSARRSLSGRRQSISLRENLTASNKSNEASSTPKRGLGSRPAGWSKKLGMFSGVFVPTCLNVLSILMFLRFGFILGKSLPSEAFSVYFPSLLLTYS